MKKLFYIVVALIIVFIGGITVLMTVVDPNEYKPLIVQQTKRATGLDLVIEGDLKWQLFPSVGIDVGRVMLKNPPGFSRENLMEVEKVVADVSVMPLFRQQIHIGQIRLDGLDLQSETRSDGQSNLESLLSRKPAPASGTVPEATSPSASSSSSSSTDGAEKSAQNHWQITVAGVAVNNAQVSMLDAVTGQKSELKDVNLAISEFMPGQWTGFVLSAKGQQQAMQFTLEASGDFLLDPDYSKVGVEELVVKATAKGAGLPQSPLNLNLKADLDADLAEKVYQLTGLEMQMNDLHLDGQSTVTLSQSLPQVRFKLHSPDIDVDALMSSEPAKAPASSAQAAASTPAPATTATQSQAEPDLTALKTLDIAGEMTIDQLKASQVILTNVGMKTTIQKGIAILSIVNADLYQGKIKAEIQLNANQVPASYQVQKQISGVQILPLLKAVAQNETLEGTGTVNVDVAGRGLSEARLKKNLTGTVSVMLTDGAINGINIAQTIRTGYAKIKGRTLPEEEKVAQKTDFSAFSASFRLKDGLAVTKDLQMKSPLLRIHGEGNVNYLNQSQDMLVRTSFVGSLKGQGGKDINELRDVTIPLKITGNWQKPRYKLVFDDVLKQKAQKELNRGLRKLDDKIKDEKTREVVNELLKKLF